MHNNCFAENSFMANDQWVARKKTLYCEDNLNASPSDFSTNFNLWRDLAEQRLKWCGLISAGAESAERQRLRSVARKRERRVVRDSSKYPFPACGRHLTARVGLCSHFRTHARKNLIQIR